MQFFSGELTLIRIRILREPGIEGTEETVAATQPGSAVLNFAPHTIGSPIKGSRQLCCRGVDSC